MDVLLLVILCVFLVWLAIQDFRSQMFYWFFLPIIFFTGFTRGTIAISLKFWLNITLINLLIALVIVCSLLAYTYFVKRDGKLLSSFGLGDILIFAAATPLLLPIHFMLTVILSSILGLGGYLIIKGKKESKRIPYAGWFSLVAASFLIVDYLML